MTLLTSFIILRRPATGPSELPAPPSIFLGVDVDPTLAGEISSSGITTGGMGNNNIPPGAPAIFDRITPSVNTEEKVNLFRGVSIAPQGGLLEPSKTTMTGLNKVQPSTDLTSINV